MIRKSIMALLIAACVVLPGFSATAKKEKSEELKAIEARIKNEFNATPEGLYAASLITFFQSDASIVNSLAEYALMEDSAKARNAQDLYMLFMFMQNDDYSSTRNVIRQGEAKAKSLEAKVKERIAGIEKEKAALAEKKKKEAEEEAKFLAQFKQDPSQVLAASEVKVGNFYIQKTELTQKVYKAVTGSNPSEFKGDKLPVEQVSWYDAVIFCNKLSELAGRIPCYSVNGSTDTSKWGEAGSDYESDDIMWDKSADGWRLPTEEEWGKAADDGHMYSGSDKLDEVAWYKDNSGEKTHEVAGKKANAKGLYDMSGNVWEWCWDRYSEFSPRRVYRGGSCSYISDLCAVSSRSRGSYLPDFGDHDLGFRVVRTVK